MQNLKILVIFKEMSLDSMHKTLNGFCKKFDGFKKLSPKSKKNQDLKPKVLDDAGYLFNELYHIYKDKYEEKKMI